MMVAHPQKPHSESGGVLLRFLSMNNSTESHQQQNILGGGNNNLFASSLQPSNLGAGGHNSGNMQNMQQYGMQQQMFGQFQNNNMGGNYNPYYQGQVQSFLGQNQLSQPQGGQQQFSHGMQSANNINPMNANNINQNIQNMNSQNNIQNSVGGGGVASHLQLGNQTTTTVPPSSNNLDDITRSQSSFGLGQSNQNNLMSNQFSSHLFQNQTQLLSSHSQYKMKESSDWRSSLSHQDRAHVVKQL